MRSSTVKRSLLFGPCAKPVRARPPPRGVLCVTPPVAAACSLPVHGSYPLCQSEAVSVNANGASVCMPLSLFIGGGKKEACAGPASFTGQ